MLIIVSSGRYTCDKSDLKIIENTINNSFYNNNNNNKGLRERVNTINSTRITNTNTNTNNNSLRINNSINNQMILSEKVIFL